jgi:hypothetical protein
VGADICIRDSCKIIKINDKGGGDMSDIKTSSLNRIFSRNTFRHLIDKAEDKTYSSVVRRYVEKPDDKNNLELISEIYTELKKNYRNEYFYKNTLLNKLLIGIHSVNTTTALTEIPIAKSKADFVLINGKAVIYEIKTALDNFDRLESQINDYYKAFNHVTVVTCKDNLSVVEKKVEPINSAVGISVLQKNGTLSTIRKPQRFDESLNLEVIFKILRKAEFESIIIERYGYLPQVTQFHYYKECKKLFLQIPLDQAYAMFLKQLKKRVVIEKDFFCEVPYELKFLAYFMELKKYDYQRLGTFLNEQFGGA